MSAPVVIYIETLSVCDILISTGFYEVRFSELIDKLRAQKVFDRQTQTDEQKTNQKQYALVYRHWGK